MSEAYLCNGCEEYHDGDPAATVETTLLRADVELCATCANKFKAMYDTEARR